MDILSILHFENFAEGLMVTVIGFSVVFFVLIFICVILMISGRLLNEKPKADQTKPGAKPVQIIKPKAADAEESTAVDDTELVAVIAAAISAYEGRTIGPDKLVVKRLRRVSGWNKEAIIEQQNRVF